ncbi:ATP-dependent RNA helicase-like protein dbp7 [Delitschia confertaspora ATCC 74209]|uniref:ATP-dependent RNA helicase n=1 Tax=Delitschia confertaspora ATCC 74209 TaxID=1513339 RepID=A0A9P4MQG0_9PLEO|nr:ATP-dependent RNA helicase-like protein dbp7 [Delitschia confertaspora ATCC 74209]
MADDGMLLNFSIPEAGLIEKVKFKGGKWKDRQTAKKSAEKWHNKATARLTGENPVSKKSTTNANHTEIGERKTTRQISPETWEAAKEHRGGERETKRARVDGEFKSSADFRPSSTVNATEGVKRTEERHGGPPPKQIISSLFTYNPTSITKELVKTDPKNETPVEPSNAPLDPKLETFTSLGISPALASHLLNKMDMKAPTAIQKAAVTQLLKEDSDAFIQAETGSGKTLAYLLPIVQRLMELSANMKKRKAEDGSGVHRDSGLFAIILAPTRELSKQIATVLDNILRCAHWLVAGTVIGGEKKKSEKARLRKGMNILVATPGRLADHLQHTEALDVSNVRWLVLDEGDRLMELGFEEEIQRIVGNLNLRMRATKNKIPGLPEKRTTVLCSATMKLDVERLGEISLKDAVHIRADPADKDRDAVNGEDRDQASFAPAQLKQTYAVVAPKLRLVSLVGFLKQAFRRKGSVMKAIVFISCADSVDFHFDLVTSRPEGEEVTSPKTETAEPEKKLEETSSETKPLEKKSKNSKVIQSDPTKLVVTHTESPILSPPTHTVTAYRLHGSLPQSLRTSTLAHFAKNKEASVLFATDVASRGLDLPNVDLVVEFDPAFARDDHLHRIGRTARAGRDGRACIFLMPGCEEGYVEILKNDRKDGESGVNIGRQDADEILKKGLQPAGQAIINGKKEYKTAYMDRATDLQLDFERWVLASPARLESARRAYQSHVRAYATHVAAERGYFDIKQLHLGHLAKAFALRERPSGMKVPGLRTGAGRESKSTRGKGGMPKDGHVNPNIPEEGAPGADEAAKMRKAVRSKEKFLRSAAADEFNLG